MTGDPRSFWDAVDAVREHDPRYPREAYGFLMMALAATVEALPQARRADPARRHVSGPELLDGVIALARGEFGVMAQTVFREWGVTRSSDIGTMVFQLIDAGHLSARPEDSREDFDGRPDLLAALGDPRPRPASGPER
jgi:uncharacterized repeat protein (TIGR04138 family)